MSQCLIKVLKGANVQFVYIFTIPLLYIWYYCWEDVLFLAIRSNFLQFDDCYIGQLKTLSLQMTNHLPMDSFRFMWPDHLYLKFSPQVGHLRPCTSKNILVTFKSTTAVRFKREPVSCYVTKIIYTKPLSEVPDWDDRIKVVKWVDVTWVDVTSPVSAPDRWAQLQAG